MPRWTRRVHALLRTLTGRGGSRTRPTDRRTPGPSPAPVPARGVPRALPDHTGPVRTQYSPSPDGRPDTGEIVWTWVPYEEDPRQGKDRPVLLVGRDGPVLLALPLTSKDHDHDAAAQARQGRAWTDIGSGPWDRQGRPSEVRLDRVLRVDPAAVRREGAVLPPDVFRRVTDSLAQHHGW